MVILICRSLSWLFVLLLLPIKTFFWWHCCCWFSFQLLVYCFFFFPIWLFLVCGDRPSPFTLIQISEADIWTWGTNLADIGNFAVPLLTYVILKTHIKWVPCTSSEKDTVRRLFYILKYIISLWFRFDI